MGAWALLAAFVNAISVGAPERHGPGRLEAMIFEPDLATEDDLREDEASTTLSPPEQPLKMSESASLAARSAPLGTANASLPGLAAPLNASLPGLSAAPLNASSLAQTERRVDEPDSTEVPYWLFPHPMSIKFTGVSGKETSIVILDRFSVATVPVNVVYVYPVVLILLYSLLWCACCRGLPRLKLSFRVVVEASACFMCLWADLVTRHQVISARRAWSYTIAMTTVLCAWNIADVYATGGAYHATVFYVFQPLVAFVWICYTVERVFVRKYYRRRMDPMTVNHYASDCASQLCCPQLSALQETIELEGAVLHEALTQSREENAGKW